MVGLTSSAGLLLLMLTSMPVGLAMALAGVCGFAFIQGWESAAAIVAITAWDSTTQYSLVVIPLFILLGNVAFYTGIGQDAYRAARAWLGHWPGGLAHATVLAGALYGAGTGSTLASSATLAKVCVPEMRRYGYSKRLSAGCVASAGCMAAMIPPSAAMVLYSMVTETDLAKLLVAGIFPGLLMMVVYMLMMPILIRVTPSAFGKPLPKMSWKERFKSTKNLIGIIVIFLAIMGALYSGISTAVEAAGVGCLAIIILAFMQKRMTFRLLLECTLSTARISGMIVLIVVGAFIFQKMLAVSTIPVISAEFVANLPIPPIGILITIMLFYIMLGTFMDGPAQLFLTMPAIFPIVQTMGWNPVWFGILYMMVSEMGMITPPSGATIFGTKSVLPDVNLMDIYRGVIPFFLADLVILAILIAFPMITLLIPNIMK
jgi:tripartite ATP-independent transporter DctM subunit